MAGEKERRGNETGRTGADYIGLDEDRRGAEKYGRENGCFTGSGHMDGSEEK